MPRGNALISSPWLFIFVPFSVCLHRICGRSGSTTHHTPCRLGEICFIIDVYFVWVPLIKTHLTPKTQKPLRIFEVFSSKCACYFFFFFSCVSVTEVGKLLGILPEADWALYVCHKAPGSLPLVSIVLFPCLDALHFGRDPNPLFHLLSLSCLFSLPHHPPRFPPLLILSPSSVSSVSLRSAALCFAWSAQKH